MPTIITSGATTITPDQVTDYESSRPINTRVHPILGASTVDVTHRPTGLRFGALTLVFKSGTASAAAETAHCVTGATFTLASSEHPSLNMTYVLGERGNINRRYDGENDIWTLRVDFQETT